MSEPSDTIFMHRKECPICSKTGQLIVDVPLEHSRLKSWLTEYYGNRVPSIVIQSGRYTLYYCEDCQFLYQAEVLSNHWLGELYERWINPEESWKKNRRMRHNKSKHEIQVASLITEITSVQQDTVRVLDFGAGWGIGV